MDERCDQLISVYCMLMVILKESSKFVSEKAAQLNVSLIDRLQVVATYLINSNFVAYYKHCILNGTESMEFGFGLSTRPINVLTNIVLSLNVEIEANKKQDK